MPEPEITPLPYIQDSEIKQRLQAYMGNPGTHSAVNYRAKEIKKQLQGCLDVMAMELALYDAVTLKVDKKTDALQVLKPSSLCWVN